MSESSSPFTSLSSALAGLVASTARHVVEVQSHRSLASGFFWRPDLVVTADETLADDGEVLIERADGKVLTAERVGRDPSTDIALLRVAGGDGAAVIFGDEPPRTGMLTLAIGAAESAPLAALGIVAAIGPAWQSMRGGTIDTRIELDLRLRPRAEGGLAIDAGGEAFGMAVRGPRGRTLVIPLATIDRVAGQLLERGRVPRPYLGAGLRDVPLEGGAAGAMVMTLDPQGPATAAGMRQGDIVMAWKGAKIVGVGGLLRTLRVETVGSAVEVGLIRGGEPLQLSITIGDRPPE